MSARYYPPNQRVSDANLQSYLMQLLSTPFSRNVKQQIDQLQNGKFTIYIDGIHMILHKEMGVEQPSTREFHRALNFPKGPSDQYKVAVSLYLGSFSDTIDRLGMELILNIQQQYIRLYHELETVLNFLEEQRFGARDPIKSEEELLALCMQKGQLSCYMMEDRRGMSHLSCDMMKHRRGKWFRVGDKVCLTSEFSIAIHPSRIATVVEDIPDSRMFAIRFPDGKKAELYFLRLSPVPSAYWGFKKDETVLLKKNVSYKGCSVESEDRTVQIIHIPVFGSRVVVGCSMRNFKADIEDIEKVTYISIGQKVMTKCTGDSIGTVLETFDSDMMVRVGFEIKIKVERKDLFLLRSSGWGFSVGDAVKVSRDVTIPRYGWTGDKFVETFESSDISSSLSHESIGVITMIPDEASYVLIDFPGHEDWKGDIEEIIGCAPLSSNVGEGGPVSVSAYTRNVKDSSHTNMTIYRKETIQDDSLCKTSRWEVEKKGCFSRMDVGLDVSIHTTRFLLQKVPIYRMKRKPFGKLLLFYNTICPGKPELNSSKLDADLMEQTFGGKFDVVRFENKTLTEMVSILGNMEKQVTEKDTCLMCYYTSHGNPDGIVTPDGETLTYAAIVKAVRNDILRCMRRKPKLVILDCCRGSDTNESMYVPVAKGDVRRSPLLSPKIHSDMTILKSSPDGFTSIAFTNQTSIFTSAFCEAFSKSTTHDYTDIVNQTTAIVKMNGHHGQCVPESTSYLDARLIFKKTC